MKLAIGSFTFPWAFGVEGFPMPPDPLTPEELIETAVRLSVKVVQIAHNVPLHEIKRDRIVAIAAAAKRNGIELELGTRGTDPETLKTFIDLCSICGATILRSVPTETIPVGDSAAEEAVASAVVENLYKVLPLLERSGVVLCLENYEGLPARLLAHIVRQIDSPNVRVCLDAVNSLGRGEGIEAVMDTLAELTGNLHIKDYTVRRGDDWLSFVVHGTPAGEGYIPLKELLGRVPESVTAVIEHWPPWQGTIEETTTMEREWAEKSVRNVRKLIGEDDM